MSNTFRPLSPHMEIYKFPPMVLFSGAQRITGVLVYLYIMAISWLIIISHYKPELPKIIMLLAADKFGFFLMMLFVIGIFYNTFNGMHYSLWAIGKCYEAKHSLAVGMLGLSLTVIATIIFFFLLR